MNKIENTGFIFSHKRLLAESVIDDVWKKWSDRSTWSEWDHSLIEAISDTKELALGQVFSVVSKQVNLKIPVTIISYFKNSHFTSASLTPMGLLAFGHTVFYDKEKNESILEHTIFWGGGENNEFQEKLWGKLKEDIVLSVDTLAELIIKERKK